MKRQTRHIRKTGQTGTLHKGANSLLLVGKRNGKAFIYQDRVNALKEKLKDDMGALIEIDATIKDAVRQINSDPNADKLTINTLKSKIATTRIEKMIINTGLTTEQVGAEIGVSENDILNEENWYVRDENGNYLENEFGDYYTGSTFYFNGIAYKFEFSYFGNVLRRIG